MAEKTTGDTLLASAGAFVILGALVFVSPLVGVLAGSLSGWIVGMVYSHTMTKALAAAGLATFEPWQIGASLGFVAGFFRRNWASDKKG